MNKVRTAYVAGRISRQDEVKAIIGILKQHGLDITRDWTWTDTIRNEADAAMYRKEVYSTRTSKYADEALEDIEAAVAADVFVILSDELGSSMYVEYGAALGAQLLIGYPLYIYVIGPPFDRMLHYQYPTVIWVNTAEEIIQDLIQKEAL